MHKSTGLDAIVDAAKSSGKGRPHAYQGGLLKA